MKDSLNFDTTDAGTITDSDKALAGLISTDGSTLITDTLVSAKQGLDVYMINANIDVNLQDGAGTDITSTGGSLDVNVTNAVSVSATDLDIRQLDHTSGGENDSVRLGDGTDFITSTLEGSKQALDVYVANAIDVDDGIADTAIANTAVAVGTVVTDLVGVDLASRKYAFIANLGNKKIFVGGSGVTTATGFPVSPGSVLEMRAGPAIDLHAIKAAGGSTNDTRILELS